MNYPDSNTLRHLPRGSAWSVNAFDRVVKLKLPNDRVVYVPLIDWHAMGPNEYSALMNNIQWIYEQDICEQDMGKGIATPTPVTWSNGRFVANDGYLEPSEDFIDWLLQAKEAPELKVEG